MRATLERLQVWSLVLPVLKCAVCPACLSLYGGLFAGARLGAAGAGVLPLWLFGAALLADVVILGLAWRHHRQVGPLALCVGGAVLVSFAHLTEREALEFVGLFALVATSLWNWAILRSHHRSGAACGHAHCSHGPRPAHAAHDHAAHATGANV